MSRKTKQVRVCIICSKRVSASGKTRYGGNLHAGWFHVERTGENTQFQERSRESEWDVCGLQCLKKLTKFILMKELQKFPVLKKLYQQHDHFCH